jgi:hypothetical protein
MRVKLDRWKVAWLRPKCDKTMHSCHAMVHILLVAVLCTSRLADAIKYEGEIVLPDTGETDHVFPGLWTS